MFLCPASIGLTLLFVPLTVAPQGQRLNPPLAPDKDIRQLEHSPDGRWVVFHDGSGIVNGSNLFTVASDGSSPPASLSTPGGFHSNMSARRNFRVTSDSAHVVFHDLARELMSASIEGAPPLRLSPPGAVVLPDPALTPDGARVVFRVFEDNVFSFEMELRSAPVDGSTISQLLVATGTDVVLGEPAVSPDSSLAYYAVADPTFGTSLRSVPVDGSAGETLVAGLPAGSQVSQLFVSPDGLRLVFVADAVTPGVSEVFSVPSDGSAAPVRLSAAPVAGGEVSSIAGDVAITADSARVVYRADQDVDERFELYGVPIDGSAAPVRLNPPLVAGQDVAAENHPSFRLSPDGSLVVFRSGPPAAFELYSAPPDGSAAALPLSTGVLGTGSVAAEPFEISPDGQRVVFLFGTTPTSLHSIPIDASAPVVTLDAPPGPGSVQSFRIAPSSASVAYVANQDHYPAEELFLIPIDGAGAPRLIGAPLTGLRRVQGYELHPSGERVVYIADQAVDEQYELWLRYTARVPRPAQTPSTTVSRTH